MAKLILFADDEPYMHRLMEHHLSRAGYEVLGATNGREALDKAAAESPDLVILDFMMPEMDGITALRLLKDDVRTSAIPVIILTASAQSGARQCSEEGGASGFFTKPFSPTQLLWEIKRLLDK